MSNFVELQADKQDWTLASDEKLLQKLKHLEDNVIASTHLVHNDMSDLNKAFNKSCTTLQNSINAFNQLSFNKFVENVVEDIEDENMLFGANQTQMPTDGGFLDQTTMLGDLKSEDEKLSEALQIALMSMQGAKEDKKQNKAQDEEGMTTQTID